MVTVAGAGNPQPTATRSYTLPRITISRTLLAATVAATAILGIAASTSSSSSSRPAGRVHVLHVHRDVGHDFIIDADDSATPAHPAPDSVGDQDVFNAKFFAGGKQVGTDGG